ALQTALAFGQEGVFSLSDLSIRPAVLVDEALGEAFAARYLDPLADLGRIGAELETTLRTWFDQGMRIEETARALHVHPNTLRHRLHRFEESTGASLRQPSDLIELWWALEGRSGFLWEQWTLPRYLRSRGHAVHIAGANYGLPLAPVGATRLVLIVHDLIPLRMPRTYLLSRPAWAVKYLLSTLIALPRAALIVTPSQATADDVRRWARHRRVGVRYPPLTGAPAASDVPELPSGWPRRFLLYNGGLDPRKNVGRLLEAFTLYRRDGGDHERVRMLAAREPAALVTRAGADPVLAFVQRSGAGASSAAATGAGV